MLSLCASAQEKLRLHENIFDKNNAGIMLHTSKTAMPALNSNLFMHKSSSEMSCNSVTSFNNSVKYTAFFCKLETKLHRHLNVWVKMRAGSDAVYRKSTGETNELNY